MSAQLSLIPPVTPPLGAMLFVSLNATSAALGISYYFGLDPRGFATPSPSFVFVRLLGCLAFLYLAGTYPMKSIMPSANVAGPKDVCDVAPAQFDVLTPFYQDSYEHALIARG
jgi:hypothetical protein